MESVHKRRQTDLPEQFLHVDDRHSVVLEVDRRHHPLVGARRKGCAHHLRARHAVDRELTVVGVLVERRRLGPFEGGSGLVLDVAHRARLGRVRRACVVVCRLAHHAWRKPLAAQIVREHEDLAMQFGRQTGPDRLGADLLPYGLRRPPDDEMWRKNLVEMCDHASVDGLEQCLLEYLLVETEGHLEHVLRVRQQSVVTVPGRSVDVARTQLPT